MYVLLCARWTKETKRDKRYEEWKREGTKSENEKAKEQVWHCTLVAALVIVTFSCYLGCGCQEHQIPRPSPGAELEHLNSQDVYFLQRLRKAYSPPPILTTFLLRDYQDHPEQLHQYMIVKLHKIRLRDCVAEWEQLRSSFLHHRIWIWFSLHLQSQQCGWICRWLYTPLVQAVTARLCWAKLSVHQHVKTTFPQTLVFRIYTQSSWV